MTRKSLVSALLSAALAATWLPLTASPAAACPFCGSVQSTLAQDINSADVAVVARLIALPPPTESKDGELNVAPPIAKFAVIEVLKGAAALGSAKQVEAPFFDDKPLGGEYLILGQQPPAIVWAPPTLLTPRSRQYISEIVKLPASGVERIAYYQEYLDDKEDLLSRDAFDEFALAPYPDLQKLKSRMHHDTIVERIQNPDITPSHRRLYLTMLGVCGGPADLPMLERLMHNDDPKFKMGLDATVACYLTLKGAAGLPLVEDLFLRVKPDGFWTKAPPEEFTDIFSVVMALRFVGQQDNGPIPRDRIVEAMRLVLDHPRLADQAVMDLARWQDWTVMDRLVELFKSKDPETTSFVRIPVINYLRACPLPQAKVVIEELRKIDPKAVQTSEMQYAIDAPTATDPAASRKGAAAAVATTAAATTPPTATTAVAGQNTVASADSKTAPVSSPDSQNSTLVALIVLGGAIGGAMLLAVVVRSTGHKAAVTHSKE